MYSGRKPTSFCITNVDATVDAEVDANALTSSHAPINDRTEVDVTGSVVANDTICSTHHAGVCTTIDIATTFDVDVTSVYTVVDVEMLDANTIDEDDDDIATWTALSTMSATIDELCTEMTQPRTRHLRYHHHHRHHIYFVCATIPTILGEREGEDCSPREMYA